MVAYMSNGTGYSPTWSNTNTGVGSAGQFFTGDVNGDGKTDIIQVWNNGGYTGMVAYTSNGTGYSPTWSNTNTGAGSAGQFFTGDVNGDGKTDIIQVWNNGGYTGLQVYTSNGTGYSPTWSNANTGVGSNRSVFHRRRQRRRQDRHYSGVEQWWLYWHGRLHVKRCRL